jgi:hypothetical protein
MRTIVKLVIAGLILNGAYRLGAAYWDHYAFEDAARDAAQFSAMATEREIAQHVVSLAAEHDIALDAADVTIEKIPRRITIDGAYTRSIELVPRYARPWDFSFHVVVLTLN